MTSSQVFQNIVIVDDDTSLQKRIETELRKHGYAAQHAVTPAEAELLAVEGETLFLIDIEMNTNLPDASGLALLGRLRLRNRHAFLGIYSNFAEMHAESARLLGADLVLSKSNLREDVLRLANAILRKRLETLAAPSMLDIKRFVLADVVAPLATGLLASTLAWGCRWKLHSLDATQTIIAPTLLSLLVVLIRVEIVGRSNRVLARWKPIKFFRRIRKLIWAAIVSGIIYDALKNSL